MECNEGLDFQIDTKFCTLWSLTQELRGSDYQCKDSEIPPYQNELLLVRSALGSNTTHTVAQPAGSPERRVNSGATWYIAVNHDFPIAREQL